MPRKYIPPNTPKYKYPCILEVCALLPESGPVGPRRAPTGVNERLCVCVSTGLVPVGETGGAMTWQFGILLDMTMQSLGVAMRWQIARYDHAKPWHGGVLACAWWLDVRKPPVCLVKALICSRVRVKSVDFAVLFERPSPARALREALCRWNVHTTVCSLRNALDWRYSFLAGCFSPPYHTPESKSGPRK